MRDNIFIPHRHRGRNEPLGEIELFPRGSLTLYIIHAVRCFTSQEDDNFVVVMASEGTVSSNTAARFTDNSVVVAKLPAINEVRSTHGKIMVETIQRSVDFKQVYGEPKHTAVAIHTALYRFR